MKTVYTLHEQYNVNYPTHFKYNMNSNFSVAKKVGFFPSSLRQQKFFVPSLKESWFFYLLICSYVLWSHQMYLLSLMVCFLFEVLGNTFTPSVTLLRSVTSLSFLHCSPWKTSLKIGLNYLYPIENMLVFSFQKFTNQGTTLQQKSFLLHAISLQRQWFVLFSNDRGW